MPINYYKQLIWKAVLQWKMMPHAAHQLGNIMKNMVFICFNELDTRHDTAGLISIEVVTTYFRSRFFFGHNNHMTQRYQRVKGNTRSIT